MMKDEELERLRAAYAVVAIGDTGSCPEPDRIWQAVRGELPPDGIREVVDHVALCASCAEDWRIAVAFEKESRVRDQKPVPFRRSTTDRFRPWIAAAAAVLILSVGGIYVRQMQGPAPPPEYRGERDKVQSLAGETRPRESFVLSWTPVEGAESYDLTVTTPELVTLAAPRGLTSPRYQVPVSALAPVRSGTRLQWHVTTVFPDGRRKQSKAFFTALR